MVDPLHPSVLIVDDTEFMRFVLKEIMEEMGIPLVAEAGTLSEAMQLFKALEPDIVAVDLATPGIDGPGLVVRMKAERPQTRIVVITTLDRRREARAALAAGARDVIITPYDPFEVRQTLEALLPVPAGA